LLVDPGELREVHDERLLSAAGCAIQSKSSSVFNGG